METVTYGQELTVWADASVLAEARHLFSHFEAAIRPIPKISHSRDVQKSKVSVVYLKHSEPRKDHISFLECFNSPKVELLLFYMPKDSSSLAVNKGFKTSFFDLDGQVGSDTSGTNQRGCVTWT